MLLRLESSKFGEIKAYTVQIVCGFHLCPVLWRLLFIVVQFEPEMAGIEVTWRQ